MSHDAAEELEGCVASLRAYQGDCTLKILIVDSGSTDETLSRARALEVDTLSLPNVGYGAANNAGWQAGPPARYIWFFNPDARIVGGSLAGLIRYADHHPNGSVFAPLLVDGSGEPVASLVPFESAWGRLCDQLRGKSVAHRYEPASSFREFGCATGCALLVRASCFDGIQGFDERFFLYADERDLQRRTVQRGSHHAYPHLVVEHETEARAPNPRLFAQRCRADLYYARKWDGPGGVAAIRVALALELIRRITARDEWLGCYLAALRTVLTERVSGDPAKARELQMSRTL